MSSTATWWSLRGKISPDQFYFGSCTHCMSVNGNRGDFTSWSLLKPDDYKRSDRLTWGWKTWLRRRSKHESRLCMDSFSTSVWWRSPSSMFFKQYMFAIYQPILINDYSVHMKSSACLSSLEGESVFFMRFLLFFPISEWCEGRGVCMPYSPLRQICGLHKWNCLELKTFKRTQGKAQWLNRWKLHHL